MCPEKGVHIKQIQQQTRAKIHKRRQKEQYRAQQPVFALKAHRAKTIRSTEQLKRKVQWNLHLIAVNALFF